MVKYFTMVSDASSTESGVFLALSQHVHVLLTEINGIWVCFKAAQERLAETVAGVLLSGLLVSGLSILSRGLHRSLLHGSLLLLDGSLVTVVWAATSHNSSDGLVSDFWTDSHGHTSGHGTTETRHHTASLSRGWSHRHVWHAGALLSSWWGVIMMVNLSGGCLLHGSGWSSGASWTEAWWASTWTWTSYLKAVNKYEFDKEKAYNNWGEHSLTWSGHIFNN